MKKLLAVACALAVSGSVLAEENAEEVSKKLSDPTSTIWAMFTSITASSYSGDIVDGNKWGGGILIEPIMPIPLSDDLKLLMRPALPIVIGAPVPDGSVDYNGYTGNTFEGTSSEYGLGNLQLPLMLSPKAVGKFSWGLGPSFIIPTNTDDALGTDVWEAGISALTVYKPKKTMVFGLLSQYWWSIDDDSPAEETSHAQIVGFGFKQIGGGREIGSSPTIIYDAKRKGTKWTVPVSLVYAHMTKLGDVPAKIQYGFDVNVVKNELYDADFTFKINVIPVVPMKF